MTTTAAAAVTLAPTATMMDAVDLVDAMDAVDLVDSTPAVDEEKDDADFDAFTSAHTLQGETVQAAQLAAVAAATADETTTTVVPEEDSAKQFVTPNDFELLKVIGMGAFGKVLQVKNRQSGQVLAMKVISKRLLKRKAGYIENIQAERNILTRVKHPFVVSMHCSFQTKEKLFIIMDFLAGGELFLRLGREGIFLEKDAAFYLAEIILGVDHLHSLGILHRDLKPENILLGNDGHICLTDFGLAKDFGPDWNAEDGEGDRASTICGTQEYMAPEMVAKKGYAKAADYWSLGCIAYEMLNGLPPFSSKQGSKELFRKIMSEKVKMPPGSTAAACKLLKGLLNRNPDARLGCARSTMFEVGGVAGLKQMPFFAKIDWMKLERRELQPPYDSSVENSEDLRHFHNDFTSMPLPRSVREMSDMDMVPRRVDSRAFRGFSFIQPNFSLPQRDATDVETYWNSKAEEDGESDSDVASSKADAAEAAQPQQPEKKKRPPRKRKKKKKDTDTMSVASSAPSEGGEPAVATPAPSVSQDANEAPTTPAAPQATTKSAPILTEPKTASQPAAPAPVHSRPKPTPTPQPKPVVKKQEAETWQSVSKTGPKIANKLKAGASPWTPKTVGVVSTPTSNQQGSASSTPAATRAPSQPTTPAPPGSWAARIQKPQATQASRIQTPSSTRVEPSRSPWSTPGQSAPPPPSPQRKSFETSQSSGLQPPSPSSNWRQHSSPQVKRALNRSTLVKGNSPSNGAGGPPSWPSLNGAPAAAAPSSDFPGLGASKSTAAPKPQSANLKGAWASRSKP